LIYPTEPTVVNALDPADVDEDDYDVTYREYYELPFDVEDRFPQEFPVLVDTGEVKRIYTIKLSINTIFDEYWFILEVWNSTDPENPERIFTRRVMENIEYNVGYVVVLFTKLEVTGDFLEEKSDKGASINGVVRYIV